MSAPTVINLRSEREIELMRRAGQIVAGALKLAGEIIRPGLETQEIDRAMGEYIASQDAGIAFKGYRGFPANVCISVNEQVVHGIPGPRKLAEGDIVGIDVGSIYHGYYGDAAKTFAVGKISKRAERLMRVTETALKLAIEKVQPYVRLYTIAETIQRYAEAQGYSVVRQYVGHGIGQEMHEDPQVPNFVLNASLDEWDHVLAPGAVIAIEPMVNEGTHETKQLSDKWTVVTKDGRLSAHFEHTVAVTETGHEVLTQLPGEPPL